MGDALACLLDFAHESCAFTESWHVGKRRGYFDLSGVSVWASKARNSSHLDGSSRDDDHTLRPPLFRPFMLRIVISHPSDEVFDPAYTVNPFILPLAAGTGLKPISSKTRSTERSGRNCPARTRLVMYSRPLLVDGLLLRIHVLSQTLTHNQHRNSMPTQPYQARSFRTTGAAAKGDHWLIKLNANNGVAGLIFLTLTRPQPQP